MTAPLPAVETWDASAFRAAVQETLTAFVDEQGRRLTDLGPDAAQLMDEARSSVSGGKRLRAAFCYWGYRGVSDRVDDPDALVRAASALELLHASALVHDDVMDASDTRRGRASTHKAFEAWHHGQGWTTDPVQYGAAAAILLGDLLLCWSDERLRTCGLPEDQVREALRWFDTTRSEVITGQFLDVAIQARGESDVAAAMRVLRYKSAKYSVERPLHVGAALAGAGQPILEAMSGFGLPIGEAFQLRDDLLGVFGDPAVTGKPAGDDLREGKRTVLVALALEAASPHDAARIDGALGAALGASEVEELRAVIERSGAHLEVERRIDRLTDQALAALEAAPVAEPARAALRDLAVEATQRVV